MKTSELIGRKLDVAVALALGATDLRYDTIATWWVTLDGRDRAISSGWSTKQNFAPSTDWAVGGPLITDHSISTVLELERYLTEIRWEYRPGTIWQAYQGSVELYQGEIDAEFQAEGPTPLTAAMRCLVLLKLGEEVEIPKEI